MNVFPEELIPTYPLSLSTEWKTRKTDFETGAKEQRRQVWTFPRRSLDLKFTPLTQAKLDTLWNFFNQQKGSFEPFWYFLPTKNSDGAWHSYTGEYVGKGNGSSVIFELPGRSTTSQTAYVNGAVTAGTVLGGSGDAGVDRIQFAAAPANGATITVNFTGQLRLRSRFGEDKMTRELFEWALYSVGLQVLEVRV